MSSASALTNACRTRTNCRMWGSSPLISASCEDSQSFEETGS